MVASTDIKFYVHTNTNAPQLQNAFGSMINVLDACLVNGFGSQTVSTLAASGTTVTATFGSAHNFMQYQVIKITGATQTEFNGEHRILTVPNANSITFQLAAAPSVTTATGTITCNLPPLGWEKPFSSSNPSGGGKAAYRSLNLLLPSRPFLRVVDELDPVWTSTYAKYAKVGIVEDMTDIDTMLGVQAPFDPALPNKNWVGTGSGTTAYNGWAKWYYARMNDAGVNGNQYDYSVPTNSVRNWLLMGCSDYFYIIPIVGTLQDNAVLYGFGAFERSYDTDMSNNFLACSDYYAKANDSSSPAMGSGLHATASTNLNFSNLLVQRKYDATAKYNNARCGSFYALNVSFFSGSQDYLASYNNEYTAAPIYLLDYEAYGSTRTIMRGKIPLIFWLYNTRPYTNMQPFVKGREIFLAKTIAVAGSVLGQVLLKIGDI